MGGVVQRFSVEEERETASGLDGREYSIGIKTFDISATVIGAGDEQAALQALYEELGDRLVAERMRRRGLTMEPPNA